MVSAENLRRKWQFDAAFIQMTGKSEPEISQISIVTQY